MAKVHADTLGTFFAGTLISCKATPLPEPSQGPHQRDGDCIGRVQQLRYAVLPWQKQAITDVTATRRRSRTSTQAASFHRSVKTKIVLAQKLRLDNTTDTS